MPTRAQTFRHIFGGGWATDFGASADVSLNDNGQAVIPFLKNAENVFYHLDGGFQKIGGTSRLNTSVLESGAEIIGLFDYWRLGTGGTPINKRVVHVGTKILKDDANGTFAEIQPSAQADDAVVSYETFDDLLIISNNADVPLKWNQSGNAATLGTNTPKFSFSETHKNRLWAAGVFTSPSRLYYSPNITNGGPDSDWDGATSGFIEIDPGDGDRITGLASHKDELWVFKGPHKGSIHRISGSAPTGGDAFGRTAFVRGLGAIAHNTIFRFRDDLGFQWADGSIHSLAATAAFGDFNLASLSLPINDEYLKKRGRHNRFQYGWAVTDPGRGYVLFSLPFDSSTTNNRVLMMDYRFNPVRWSLWPAIAAGALAYVIDTGQNNTPAIWAGGNDGFVRKLQIEARSIDGSTTIATKVTTPHLDYGAPFQMKRINNTAVGIVPKGSFNATFSWTRDDNPQQSETFAQDGGDVLAGSVSNTSITVFADNGSSGTTVTANAHGLAANDKINIHGTTSYNGVDSAIAAVTTNTFDIDTAFVANDATGTVQSSSTNNFFVLGTSVLSGSVFANRFIDLIEGGEFRTIEYEITQNGLGQDVEVHAISTVLTPGSVSLEN